METQQVKVPGRLENILSDMEGIRECLTNGRNYSPVWFKDAEFRELMDLLYPAQEEAKELKDDVISLKKEVEELEESTSENHDIAESFKNELNKAKETISELEDKLEKITEISKGE